MRLAAALLALGLGGPAVAGTLVELRIEGVPLRLESGADPDRLRARLDGRDYLVDLVQGTVTRTDGRPAALAALGERAVGMLYGLEPWGGRRLSIAGERASYLVLKLGETTCGEVLAASWTRPLIGRLVRAVELLQRLDDRIRPRERGRCGAVPFSAYAAKGWPLLAGWSDRAIVETDRIDLVHPVEERAAR